jgi:hypothetical protein
MARAQRVWRWLLLRFFGSSIPLDALCIAMLLISIACE